MVVLPVIIAVVLHMLKFDKVTVLALCLMAAMPVGNLPLIQAEKTGQDTELLSSAITVSTVVSLVTITILMSVLSVVL